MKKEKLFKVGIINESTIDVVKDMTTFYTSDTELWLGFELSEEGVKFDSAEILMFNIDDKSFVIRSVVKTDDKYWYELDMDMIAHHGEWQAQLQFAKDSEVYTSKHFNFRIENDLSNERPPKLIDITNWSNIKQTADSLIAEMKVAVTEAIEAEQNRAEAFTHSEQSRQTNFEANESERTDTFNANEEVRKAQELEREGAEATRQSVFDENEATRDETFSANEVLRQGNETTRQEAETQRASAESSRASAEAQRKIDHASRSAELDGKADKVVLKNEIENGNFSDGTAGWSPIRTNLSASNNILSATNNSVMLATWGHFTSSVGEIEVGHKIYMHVNMRVTNDEGISIYTVLNTSSGSDVAPQLGVRNPIINKWYNISGVSTAIKGDTNCKLSIRHFYSSIESAQSKVMEVNDVIVVNLTDIFGVGNEPTKEEMDELIKVTGYIDGEYALNNKEMLIWTLALIRRNKNAIVALGGTI